MTVPQIVPDKTEFEPTTAQQQRAASMRRFNTLYIYLPIGFFGFVAIIIVLILLYLSLNPPAAQTLKTISGIADAVVILGTVPAIIICGIIPTLAIVGTVQARRRGMAPLRQLQVLLWRMDRGVGIVRQKVDDMAPKIARPFIQIHGAFAYVQNLFNRIVRVFKRS